MREPSQARKRQAAERVRLADRKVKAAERVLHKAIKARDRATARYLSLVPSFQSKGSNHG